MEESPKSRVEAMNETFYDYQKKQKKPSRLYQTQNNSPNKIRQSSLGGLRDQEIKTFFVKHDKDAPSKKFKVFSLNRSQNYTKAEQTND